MSHTTEMKTDYLVKNEKELIDALKHHFGDDGVEVHDTPVDLLMFNGQRHVAGYGQAGKANIIVRKAMQERALGHGAAVNDLGFVRKEDGTFEMRVDNAGFPQQARDKVIQDYTALVTAKTLKKQGYTVKTTTEKGVVKVKASKYLT
jgi:hypothetical protein